MGYEILYHFYPRKTEGVGYNTDVPETFTKQLGKMEEVPVEKLANAIMLQLARRDIMVYDVEIFEFTKKQISFKETKGGVLIKNKKFMLDGTIEMVEEQQSEEQQQPEEPSIKVIEKPSTQPIRWEVFDPDPALIASLTKKFRLTPKRKYPLLEEKTGSARVNVPGMGMIETPSYEYVVMDDNGQKIKIPAMHFTPEQKGLIGMPNIPITEQDYANQPRLMHMENHDSSMPVLRR